MPNAHYSPYETPVHAAIAGFDKPDELQFVRVRQKDGSWDEVFFGYDYQVKRHLQGFRGTYTIYDRHGKQLSCLTQIY